jgi:hypothetical protein
VSVAFTIKGETKTAKGFTWTPWLDSVHGGVNVAQVNEDVRALEAAITAHDMDKAKTALDRICKALPQVGADPKKMDPCLKQCTEIQAALNAGNRDKAQKELDKFKAQFRECCGEERKEEPKRNNEYKK